MTDDIVTRLREQAYACYCSDLGRVCSPCQERAEAADEIERLRSETKKTLRRKLRNTARESDEWRQRYLNASAGKPIQNVINVTVDPEALEKRFGGDIAVWSRAVAETIKQHREASRD